MTEHPRATRRRSVLVATTAAPVLALTLALAGCTDPEPTLLQESDFGDVFAAHHDPRLQTYVPGPLWCSNLQPSFFLATHDAISVISLDSGDRYPWVGAMVGSDSYEMGDTDFVVDQMKTRADWCGAGDEDDPDQSSESQSGWSLEPLIGLGDGAVGWRARDDDHGEWGEFAVIPLDETHLLAVGFETDKPEPPIEINELIRLALEGVERVGLDDHVDPND